MYDRATQAAHAIREKIKQIPSFALTTGSGMSEITGHYETLCRIPYADIPHFNTPTFHKGELLHLKAGNKSFLCLNGRLHYYEGFSLPEVTFPIRVLSLLGIEKLLMTNASGGLNPDYQEGEIVIVKDHINLFPDNPLRGPNDDRFGIRFPDMSNAYDTTMRQDLLKINPNLKQGVYVGLPGPSLETPAEYKYLNIIGGDMVGMSTVPEVIVAHHCSIRTAVLSVITNVCYPPEVIKETTVEMVIKRAESAIPHIKNILDSLFFN